MTATAVAWFSSRRNVATTRRIEAMVDDLRTALTELLRKAELADEAAFLR